MSNPRLSFVRPSPAKEKLYFYFSGVEDKTVWWDPRDSRKSLELLQSSFEQVWIKKIAIL